MLTLTRKHIKTNKSFTEKPRLQRGFSIEAKAIEDYGKEKKEVVHSKKLDKIELLFQKSNNLKSSDTDQKLVSLVN